MLKVLLVYLNNGFYLSQRDGMCIVGAVASGLKSILHHKTFLKGHFLCFCIVNKHHLIFGRVVNPFIRQVLRLGETLTLEAQTS